MNRKGVKRFMVKRWVSLVCLCFVLLGVPVVMDACADLGGGSAPPTYAANGSLQYPYPVAVSKGTCTAWKIVYGGEGDLPDLLCAQVLPTQHVGMYVQLSYSGMTQTVCLVSIDARRQVARVQ